MDYTELGATPWYYKCSKCGAEGCKLWRQAQTLASNIKLLCANCSEKNQHGEIDDKHPSAIGWLVEAVPTEDGDTFWGRTSIPKDGCDWWDSLPTRPPVKT